MNHSILYPRLGIGCIFQLQKFKAAGTITATTPRFHNVMLNSGLDLLTTRTMGEFDCCNLGTGGGLDRFDYTGLTEYLTSSTTILESLASYNSGIGYDHPALRFWRKKFEFAIGSISKGVSEIGLSVSEDTEYLNRHRIVAPDGVNIGLDVQLDEGLIVWTDVYLFCSHTVEDIINGAFLFKGIDGNRIISYTWELLSGWLEEDFAPGRIEPDDIRIVETPTNTPGSGIPATAIEGAYVDGTHHQNVYAVWDPKELDGTYWGLLIQNGDGTYGKVSFDSSISMDPVMYPHISLKLKIERSWGRTILEGEWL